jgi:pyrroloquinoline quinone biosynthesis protein E
MMTGDANNTDPVCSKSPHHDLILNARQAAEQAEGREQAEPVFRNERNSRVFCKG